MSAAVQFTQVSKYYSRQIPFPFLRRVSNEKIVGVEDVTLEVFSGEIFGLVGRNGQGKTTLMKCLSGLIEPSSGHIEIFGKPASIDNVATRRLIGLVSSDERSFYWRLTGWQNLLFFSRLHGMNDAEARRRIEPLLERFQLKELAQRRFDGYSAGNKQRLAIIRALLNNPVLLILDEPTRSLDPIAADSLRRLILDWKMDDPQRTAIITSHNLAEIESLCQRIGILSHNRLRECATMEELRLRYPSHDQVRMLVRDEGDQAAFAEARQRVPSLRRRAIDDAMAEYSFAHRDGELNAVLSCFVRKGQEITACQTVRVGLREILEQVDGQD